jgi:protein SPIRAL1 and related proteins
MSRGGSAGGGQSSLGYLFGSGEVPAPKPAAEAPPAVAPPAEKPAAVKAEVARQIPAGVASQTNNYHRADGQNTGNFLTVCYVLFCSLFQSFAAIVQFWLTIM